MPPEIENRIVALVSDGFRGLCYLAKKKILDKSTVHFHLLAQFKVQLGFWKNCQTTRSEKRSTPWFVNY